jgi:hypothetical protein
MRVAVAAVDAWWVAGGKEIKSGGSVGFFVGGVFPIGN